MRKPTPRAEAVIGREDPAQADVERLLALSDAYHAERYPAESNHLLDMDALRAPQTTFLAARLDGEAVGTIAMVAGPEGAGEIKRLFVRGEARGLGLGRRLLVAVEAEARGAGIRVLRLETGIRQPEAIGLYRAAGYRERGPFGAYREAPDPLSVYMEKRLDPVGAEYPVLGRRRRGPTHVGGTDGDRHL